MSLHLHHGIQSAQAAGWSIQTKHLLSTLLAVVQGGSKVVVLEISPGGLICSSLRLRQMTGKPWAELCHVSLSGNNGQWTANTTGNSKHVCIPSGTGSKDEGQLQHLASQERPTGCTEFRKQQGVEGEDDARGELSLRRMSQHHAEGKMS